MFYLFFIINYSSEAIVQINLYDSKAAIPQEQGDHILVFAGRGSLLQDGVDELVTEIICSYQVGDSRVDFPRNGDATTVRFEQAFSWAVKYAAAHGIETVHGVFELDRPLDRQYLNRICPSGLTDRREQHSSDDGPGQTKQTCPACGETYTEFKAVDAQTQLMHEAASHHLTPCAEYAPTSV
jgi:hypothetical protein